MHRASAPDSGAAWRSRLWRALPWRALPWLVALVALVLVTGDAWARVGGGQGYSGGGGSSSGGGYGGGGGGDGGAIIQLLIWLVIQHPAIGIPLTIFAIVVFVYTKSQHGGRTIRTGHHLPQQSGMARQRSPGRRVTPFNADRVIELDPNFSEPLFIDFAQLVYARVQRARGDGDMGQIRPLVSDTLLGELTKARGDLSDVRDVIFGSTALTGMEKTGKRLKLLVTFETNLTEEREGRSHQLLRREQWTFVRDAEVLSPGPERMRSLGCSSCGSPLEPAEDGRCPNCSAVRTGGHLQWMVDKLDVLSTRALTSPELHVGGGVEAGTRTPTRTHPDLPVQMRALGTRHPGWDWQAFQDTATQVFLRLQQAWSEQKWELARPVETDALFQTHRFWMERYARAGLVNKLDRVAVRRIEPVKVTVDAYYEAVTIRIFASMHDWTERTNDGKVVGGSKTQPRVFSEYWTFIRRIGAMADPDAGGWNADNCPSCGAPLDNVNQAGICGYCEAKITTGDFDWVLTRIEQDEAYQG